MKKCLALAALTVALAACSPAQGRDAAFPRTIPEPVASQVIKLPPIEVTVSRITGKAIN